MEKFKGEKKKEKVSEKKDRSELKMLTESKKHGQKKFAWNKKPVFTEFRQANSPVSRAPGASTRTCRGTLIPYHKVVWF